MPQKKDPPDRTRGMVAYNSLLSSRWIISAMRPEDYDAFLVYSTRIFACLTYAEYQRTFKYLQRFDEGGRRLPLLIRTRLNHRINPRRQTMLHCYTTTATFWNCVVSDVTRFCTVKKYIVRYASYFSAYLKYGEYFRKKIRKFGKRCFLDTLEDNVYITVIEVSYA